MVAPHNHHHHHHYGSKMKPATTQFAVYAVRGDRFIKEGPRQPSAITIKNAKQDLAEEEERKKQPQ